MKKTFDVSDFKTFLKFYKENKEEFDLFLNTFETTTIIVKVKEKDFGYKVKKWIIKKR